MAYTKEEIVELARKVHGDRYDYSITEGTKNILGKIRYICPKHGVVEQILHNHLQGKGCLECYNENRAKYTRLTNETFLEKASTRHKDLDEYDFSSLNVDDRDEKGKIAVVCKVHGKFMIDPMYFIKGGGCPMCHGKKHKTDEEVVEELSRLHPTLDFSKTRFSERDSQYRIKVICPKHGEQLIKYYNLRNGQGCYWCGRESASLKKTVSNEEFISRGRKLFGDKYTYEKLDMLNRDEDGKVIVTCREHGDFKALPTNFYNGVGCPKCNESSLEREIRVMLEENSIDYVYRDKFDWLGSLEVDFYLPKYNVAIECQGRQHFEPCEFFGGENGFKKTVERDDRKRLLCEENGVRLLYYANFSDVDFKYDVCTSLEELKRKIEEG